jgi:cell division protein FtsB
MAKNRKNGSAERFKPAVKAALICVLLGVSAVGYVYQKNQIIALGRQIKQREVRLKQLGDDNAKLWKNLQTLQSATVLEDRARKLNLGLVQPAQSQILTIIEMPATAAPNVEPPQAGPQIRRIAALK